MIRGIVNVGMEWLLFIYKWIRDFVFASLISFLGILIICYIAAFIFIAIGTLSKETGLYNATANSNASTIIIYIHKVLNFFPSNADIVSLAETGALLLLGILLIGIFKKEGITILPFEVDAENKDLSGKIIAEMIIVEFNRILRIHKDYIGVKIAGNLRQNSFQIPPNMFIKKEIMVPSISFKNESLTQNLESVGTVGVGLASLPLGSILILIRQLCPLTEPGIVVTGCVHKDKSGICIEAHIKWRNSSWCLSQKTRKPKIISSNDILCLVRDLCFNIIFEELNSKQSVLSAPHELSISRDSTKDLRIHELPSTWRVLKEFTLALESLSKYSDTKDELELEKARKSALRVLVADNFFEGHLPQLFSIGIAYLNLSKYNDAERFARFIVLLRPDSPFAWYSWGLSLRMLRLDEEAIKCYDKISELNESEEKKAIRNNIKVMKAMSLRRLNRYNESITNLKEVLREMDKEGFVWGHYGLSLEANKCKEKEKIKDAYEKAIEYFPEFVSVYSSLARIYREDYKEKPQVGAKERADEMCKKAQKKYAAAIRDLNEYNRACFSINCGQEYEAKELLQTAIEKRQVQPQWIKNDPDWKTVKNKLWFKELLNKSNDDEDINDLITKAAAKGKLAKEFGRNPSFFQLYDIKDPIELAMKIFISDNGTSKYVSEYLKERFPSEDRSEIESSLKTATQKRPSNSVEIYAEAHKISKLEKALIKGLNTLLEVRDLYDMKRFSQIKLSDPVQKRVDLHLSKNKTDLDPCDLNRRLLRDTYPGEMGSNINNLTKPEICDKIRGSIMNKSSYARARFFAVDSDKQKALNFLRKALDDNEISNDDAQFEPDFEFLRDDPRFKAILGESSKKIEDVNIKCEY